MPLCALTAPEEMLQDDVFLSTEKLDVVDQIHFIVNNPCGLPLDKEIKAWQIFGGGVINTASATNIADLERTRTE